MTANSPYISLSQKPRWVLAFERVIMAVLIVLACSLIITIPFVLFTLEKDRTAKSTRDRWNVIFLSVFTTCIIFNIGLTMVMFFSAYVPHQPTLDAVPLALWNALKGKPVIFLASIACSSASSIAINRLATNILHHEEGEAWLEQGNIWERWLSVFKWKNERNCITSGNETLWKVKTAAAWTGLAGIALLVLTPFALTSGLVDVVEAIEMMDKDLFEALSIDDYVISGIYVLFAGGAFIVSNMAMWFYMGRMFSYQAEHDIKRGMKRAWFIRIVGYVVSAHVFIPLAITFTGGTPFAGFIFTTAVTGAVILCLAFVTRRFARDPANLILDPKAVQFKHREAAKPLHQDGIKRACAGFLIAAVVGLSVAIGCIWFPATAAYSAIAEPYEWGFYLFLGLAITAGPIILLFFLRNVYARRALMVFFAAIVLILAVQAVTVSPLDVRIAQVFHAIVFGNRAWYTTYSGSLSTSERPLHIILVLLYIGTAAVAFMVVKRKAIPVSITTPKHASFSSWRNLRAFLFTSTRRRSTRANVAMLSGLVMVAGMLATFQPPVTIVLNRDPANAMRVSFWSYTTSLPNSTLQILGDNHARLFGPAGNAYDGSIRSQALRYAAHGVEIVPTISMPHDATELADLLVHVDTLMDSWDLYGLANAPYIGFAFDVEDMDGLRYFNTTFNDDSIAATRQLQEHIEARGHGLYLTEYMLTIGDMLDGDDDLAINNKDPIDFTWNLSQFDWMLYRAESAISYNEPHAMFTYEWARFMKNAITRIGGEDLFRKTSFSIGVANDDMPLYRDPGGLDELLLDAKICQAMGIPAITVFQLGIPSDGQFLEKWGDAGIARFYAELETFNSVSFPFQRRATFFGNLKGTDNPTGSVFGFFFQDVWLDEWVGYTCIPWIAAIVVAPVLAIFTRGFGRPDKHQTTKRAYSNDWIDRSLILGRVALYSILWLLLVWMGLAFFNPTYF